MRILTEPKNALCKQYQKLISYDNAELEFAPGALEAIAQKAIDRKIGARGLRAVLEGLMTNVMYELPSDPSIRRVVVTEECVKNGTEPVVIHDNETQLEGHSQVS